ncbi:hypothetical protein N9Y92_00855 [Chlamydiales bacterium]|nr:hypothetical protein [Chlamydiales bacterium]
MTSPVGFGPVPQQQTAYTEAANDHRRTANIANAIFTKLAITIIGSALLVIAFEASPVTVLGIGVLCALNFAPRRHSPYLFIHTNIARPLFSTFWLPHAHHRRIPTVDFTGHATVGRGHYSHPHSIPLSSLHPVSPTGMHARGPAAHAPAPGMHARGPAAPAFRAPPAVRTPAVGMATRSADHATVGRRR